jgi:TRAP-type mannitol/chloroaromatic compound transport system permease small subunit
MKILGNIEKFNRLMGYLGAAFVVPLMVAVVYEVFMRYVLNAPTEWVYDASWMLFSAVFLLGGAYTMMENRHVRVDIIYSTLPRKIQIWHDLFFLVVVFLPVIAILTYRGYLYAAMSWACGENLSTTMFVFPAAPVKTLIPLSFGMLFMQGIVELVKNLRMAFGKVNDHGA